MRTVIAFSLFIFLQLKSFSQKSETLSFPFIFNVSTVFNTIKDQKINNFLSKYGYASPNKIPTGIRIEIAGKPIGGRFIYSLNASTIISPQQINTADISLSIYYSIVETKKWMITSGLSVGEHFDRLVLNGKQPVYFDSLSQVYHSTLSLHRTGFVVEPGVKLFWYPFQSKHSRMGLFAGIYYDFDFNSRWRVGYYPHNGATFKNLKKPSRISTTQESGLLWSVGLSIGL